MINKIRYTLDRGLAVFIWIMMLSGIYQGLQQEFTIYNVSGVIFLTIVFSLVTSTVIDEKYYSRKYFK